MQHNRIAIHLGLIVLLACDLLLTPAGLAATGEHRSLSGRVTKVLDGDSLILTANRKNYEIRLGEIDAPEWQQPWGKQARKALSQKILNQRVTAVYTEKDSYGRLVATVTLETRNINAEMVGEGHAWVYRRYLKDQSLLEVESVARKRRAGLWQHAEPSPPWVYRRNSRNKEAASQPSNDSPRCGTKRYCGQMSSCTEARFHFQQCGLTRLDGDGDGVPCESLCR